ncbi:MAG TPA: ABC transporter permease [Thermoanaerobaculia bacterium]|nr:ABC transporter permease [Thermoanaerobaculia bacterium]
MSALLRDLRFAARMLLKRPGLTTVIVLTLALGIAGNTVMFSLVDAVLLRPLSYPDPDRLVQVVDVDQLTGERGLVSPADFHDWREQSLAFQGLAAYFTTGVNLMGADGPERVISGVASADYFRVLGTRPAVGRFFDTEDEKPGGQAVAVISQRLWKRRFAEDPGVVGQSMTVSGMPVTIIGVLPADFQSPESNALEEDPSLWRPLVFQEPWLKRDGSRWLQVVARLKHSVPLDEARHEMAAIGRRLEKDYQATNVHRGVAVVPLQEYLVGDMRVPLSLLFGAVALVLLIGCANVSNLLLARAETRHIEFSARLALGAKRSHVLRQLLAESLLMALLAAVVGLLFARWGIDAVVALYAGELPRLQEAVLDGRVMTFTLAISIATVAVFGLAPATAALGVDFYRSLQQGARGVISASPQRRRMRGLLVVSEVAVALALLVGAGLLLRNFQNLIGIEPGFDAKNVLTVQMVLPREDYPDEGSKARFAEHLCERAGNISGVSSCGVTSFLPLTPGTADRDYWVEGQALPKPGEVPQAGRRLVSPGYFTAMGIPLVKGRPFSAIDRAGKPGVAIVNESLARRAWPNEDPVGKRISVDKPEAGKWLTVVGVAKDIRHTDLQSEPAPELYQPFSQRPWFAVVLILRTDRDSGSLVPWVRQEVLHLDPRMPLYDIQTMEQRLATSLSRQRFSLFVLGVLSAIGLFLAAVGIYSVMAYIVSQRKHDLSVRMAIGAQRGDILGLVMRQGMRLVMTGIAVGVGLALVLTRMIAALLYQVTPTDPLTFAGVALLMAGVAALANYVPAWRATRLNPIIALRA